MNSQRESCCFSAGLSFHSVSFSAGFSFHSVTSNLSAYPENPKREFLPELQTSKISKCLPILRPLDDCTAIIVIFESLLCLITCWTSECLVHCSWSCLLNYVRRFILKWVVEEGTVGFFQIFCCCYSHLIFLKLLKLNCFSYQSSIRMDWLFFSRLLGGRKITVVNVLLHIWLILLQVQFKK